MERFLIQVPLEKSHLVQQLLRELGVIITAELPVKGSKKDRKPNALTVKTIENARKGVGVGEPIKDIRTFMNSI